ncbi:unnamed protein product [Lampetra planeri]
METNSRRVCPPTLRAPASGIVSRVSTPLGVQVPLWRILTCERALVWLDEGARSAVSLPGLRMGGCLRVLVIRESACFDRWQHQGHVSWRDQAGDAAGATGFACQERRANDVIALPACAAHFYRFSTAQPSHRSGHGEAARVKGRVTTDSARSQTRASGWISQCENYGT